MQQQNNPLVEDGQGGPPRPPVPVETPEQRAARLQGQANALATTDANAIEAAAKIEDERDRAIEKDRLRTKEQFNQRWGAVAGWAALGALAAIGLSLLAAGEDSK
jgi:hypothetical protein